MVILCEDRQQEVFARHYLIQCGVPRAKIGANICPKGKQAGEQYVREHYSVEASAHRSKSSFLSVGLTGTDADTLSVRDRLQTLDEALLIPSDRLVAKSNGFYSEFQSRPSKLARKNDPQCKGGGVLSVEILSSRPKIIHGDDHDHQNR